MTGLHIIIRSFRPNHRSGLSAWIVPWLILFVHLFYFQKGDCQWTTVAPGIEYRQFVLADPNNVFVTRCRRNDIGCIVDTSVGLDRLRGGRETVSAQALRYEDTINWSGERYDVIAAINGDFFSYVTDQPDGGQMCGGWLIRRFPEGALTKYGLLWRSGTSAEIYAAGDIADGADIQRVIFADGDAMPIDGLNASRGPDQLVLYTPHWDAETGTDNSGTEVVVELLAPLSPSASTRGVIREIRRDRGSTPIRFDHIILSAAGTAAVRLSRHVRSGEEVIFQMRVNDNGSGGSVPTPFVNWSGAWCAIDGQHYFLKNGLIPPDAEWSFDAGSLVRHPRTIVAWDDSWLFFVVIDGRSTISRGMTIREAAVFCRDSLQARHGVNLDGGGSSTLWVNGQVKNHPSDGAERPVANGLLMARRAPVRISSRFSPGMQVMSTGTYNLRLGPGMKYGVMTVISPSSTGMILSHRLSGVQANGFFWYYVRFNDFEGWIAESALAGKGDTRPHDSE